jgi:tRNA (guanosine-2'-O-)-methyltransferase
MTSKQELLTHLSQFLLDRRLELFEKVISYRTRYITVVLEDVFQAQNASAVLRTCECFGIQDIHLIQNRNKFKLDKEVTLGSDKWLDIYQYKSTTSTIKHLKKEGYRIIATTPGQNAKNLYDFDLGSGKIALMFGTELTGLTDSAIRNSDELLSIPMYGFTESFNLSVSAALTLQFLTKCLRDSKEINWKLTDDDHIEVMLCWLRKSIRKAELIEKRFSGPDKI